MSFKTKLLLLLGFVFLVYLPSFGNPFIWDDEQFIYKNTYVTSFKLPELLTSDITTGAGIVSNYFRPLTSLSFAIDYQLWGLNPVGFHLTNLLLHLGAGFLLIKLLTQLKLPTNLAWLSGALFLLHPVQTEAVTYINSRGDSLFSFWLLLSLVSFKFFLSNHTSQISLYDRSLNITRWHWGVGSVFAYCLSLMAKEIALAGAGLFPLLVVHQLLSTNHTNKKSEAQFAWTLPFIVISLGYATLRFTALQFGEGLLSFDPATAYGSSVWVRLATFISTLTFYGQILVLPFPLHMERSTEIVTSFFSWPVFLPLLILLGLAGAGYYEYRTKRSMWIWFGISWFLVMLVPVSGIVPINGLVYEHWLYIPQIGFFLVLLQLLKLLPDSWQRWWPAHRLSWYVAVTCLLILSGLTLRQNYLWGDHVRFYEYTLQFSKSARLYNNLAMAYSDRNNLEQAKLNYQKALVLNPEYPQIHHNLGQLYFQQQKLSEAKQAFETALSKNPDFYYSYPYLLQVYLELGEAQLALTLLEKMLVLSPASPELLQLNQQLKNRTPLQETEATHLATPSATTLR